MTKPKAEAGTKIRFLGLVFCCAAGLLSCRAGFHEAIAELMPEFAPLGVVPDQIGLARDFNTGGYLVNNGFDFGGHISTSVVEKKIKLENRGNRDITFDAVELGGTGAGSFACPVAMPFVVAAGSQFDLPVSFTPQADTSSTAMLVLSNKQGRQLRIALSGSGFPQPSSIVAWTKLALWLRADRIRLEDLVPEQEFSANARLASWPDYGPRRFLAKTLVVESIDSSQKTYPELVPNSHNGLPGIRFTGEELMEILLPQTSSIADDSGTTTIVVFKTAKLSDTLLAVKDARILTASFASKEQEGFPILTARQWYFDPVDGLYGNGLNKGQPKTQIRFDLGGWLWDSPRSPRDSKDAAVLDTTVYALALVFDASIEQSTSQDNVFFWRNGSATGLSYLHSYSGNQETSGTMNNGALGLPISNGNGVKNPDIGTSEKPYSYDYAHSAPDSLFFNTLQSTNKRIQNLHIGRKPSGEKADWQGFRGDILEIMVFSEALSTSDMEVINSYLKKRYGL